MNPLQEEMMHRFCRYVRIPSQSKPNGGTQGPQHGIAVGYGPYSHERMRRHGPRRFVPVR